jgi:hypothetical protein
MEVKGDGPLIPPPEDRHRALSSNLTGGISRPWYFGDNIGSGRVRVHRAGGDITREPQFFFFNTLRFVKLARWLIRES